MLSRVLCCANSCIYALYDNIIAVNVKFSGNGGELCSYHCITSPNGVIYI